MDWGRETELLFVVDLNEGCAYPRHVRLHPGRGAEKNSCGRGANPPRADVELAPSLPGEAEAVSRYPDIRGFT